MRRTPASIMGSRVIVTAAACLLLSLAPGRLRAQTNPGCQASPVIKAAIDALPSRQGRNQTDWQYHQQRLAAIQSLLRQYPGDFFVQQTYINFMTDSEDRTKAIAEYKAKHDQNPNDAMVSYLYGIALVGRHSPEAIKLFESALRESPGFAWPHYSLARIYTSPVFVDNTKASANIKAFLNSCPAVFDGYDELVNVDDPRLQTTGASQLRKILSTRSDADAIGEYTTLWSLEFKTTPVADYGPLRKQVGADLARIRAIHLKKDDPQWHESLQEGYKLANDQKNADWARDALARAFPNPYQALGKWIKDHPRPQDDGPAAAKTAYYTDLLNASAQWVKDWPVRGAEAWSERLDAMEHLDNIPASEIEAAVDQAVAVAESNAGPSGPASYYYLNAADVLARKHLEPQRLVDLAQKALARLDVESNEPMYDLYATQEMTDNNNFYYAESGLQGREYVAQGYIEMKQSAKARSALAQTDDALQNLDALIKGKDDRRKEYLSQESVCWGLKAQFAELQGHKLDAMAYYEAALLSRLQAQQKPATGEKDELAENAHTLWVSLGGTNDGWNAWYGKQEQALASLSTLTWEDTNEPLTSFKLTDLSGKQWTMADLKGKVTLLNFWASW